MSWYEQAGTGAPDDRQQAEAQRRRDELARFHASAADILMARAGEAITPELARERAAQIATLFSVELELARRNLR